MSAITVAEAIYLLQYGREAKKMRSHLSRYRAERLAMRVRNKDLKEMIDRAFADMKNWETFSRLNPTRSKVTTWMILAHRFDPAKRIHDRKKIELLMEFGQYLGPIT